MPVTIQISDDLLQRAAEDAVKARVARQVEEASRAADRTVQEALKEATKDIPSRVRRAVETVVFEAVDARRDALLAAVEEFLGTPEKVREVVRQKLGPAVDRILQDTVRRLTGRE